jgi:integrase/recombinase XerD
MTRLRKMMLEELKRRNYSQHTTRYYIRTVEDFARRFNLPPDRLGPRHIREYQAELFQKRKVSAGTVTNRLAALRFFYIKTLKKAWSIAETPYPKKTHRLPTILSQEEVARLIDAADTPFHRTLLITLYATGLRCAELTHLKVSHVDSKRMVIRVQGGKWRKYRDVMLSPKLLEELRKHWHRLRRKPSDWLFPGNRWHTADHPIDTKTVWQACDRAWDRSGWHWARFLRAWSSATLSLPEKRWVTCFRSGMRLWLCSSSPSEPAASLLSIVVNAFLVRSLAKSALRAGCPV